MGRVQRCLISGAARSGSGVRVCAYCDADVKLYNRRGEEEEPTGRSYKKLGCDWLTRQSDFTGGGVCVRLTVQQSHSLILIHYLA